MKKNVMIYIPSQSSSIVELFNRHLKNRYKEISDTDTQDIFQVFIHKELIDKLKDPQKFFNDYIEFMQKWNMPYVFFPYYTYFNKVLQDMVGTPNPRVQLNVKDVGKVNIVNQICQGCIILNVNKLKSINFIFDKEYPVMYFLQDMVQKCYQAKLWPSNCWFIDRLNSWQDLKVIDTAGWTINGEHFQQQKVKYQQKKIEYHPIQVFLDNLKNWKVNK